MVTFWTWFAPLNSTFNSYPVTICIFSNHLAITMNIELPTSTPIQSRTITFRNLNSLSPAALSASLTHCLSHLPCPLMTPLTWSTITTVHSPPAWNSLPPPKQKLSHSPTLPPGTPPNEILETPTGKILQENWIICSPSRLHRPPATIQRCTQHSPEHLLLSPHPLWLKQLQGSVFHHKLTPQTP